MEPRFWPLLFDIDFTKIVVCVLLRGLRQQIKDRLAFLQK